jgi:diguanylate cyclase (GGDEF)-like protein
MPKMLKKAKQEKFLVAFFLLDVDHFKKYNDHYGHPEGDQVLSAIGKAQRQIFQRSEDKVFRLGVRNLVFLS